MHPRHLLAVASFFATFLALTACQTSSQPQSIPESPVAQVLPTVSSPTIPTPTLPHSTILPTPTVPLTPTSTRTPIPTLEPKPAMTSIWELDAERVFSISQDNIVDRYGRRSNDFKDKEPLVLNGCRISLQKGKDSGAGYLFTHDGTFNHSNYLTMVLGKHPVELSAGRCYEMLVEYSTSTDECYYVTYSGLPRNPFSPCPKDAKRQYVPRFHLASPSLWTVVDGKSVKAPERKYVRPIWNVPAPLPTPVPPSTQ